MIQKIGVKNFKAFKDAELEIKPLTILLGTNSSGKSSLMQAILLLKQTFSHQGKLENALKVNGNDVSLGESLNLIHNRNVKNNQLVFHIDLKSNDLKNWIESTREDILKSVAKLTSDLDHVDRLFVEFIEDEKSTTKENRFTKFNFRNQIFSDFLHASKSEIESGTFENLIGELKKVSRRIRKKFKENPELIKEISERRNSKSLLFPDLTELSVPEEAEVKEFRYAFDFYTSILKVIKLDVGIDFTIRLVNKDKKQILKTEGLKITSSGETLLNLHYDRVKNKKPIVRLESSVFDNSILNKFRNKLWKNIVFDSLYPIPKDLENKNFIKKLRKRIKEEYFVDYLYRFMDRSLIQLRRDFQDGRIHHISPLRAYPRRYYFLDDSIASGNSINSISGSDLAGTLKSDRSIKKRVNEWLNKFGFSVNVSDLESLIHQLKVSQNGVQLDITDVGFGLSQVLPIIVHGFLSRYRGITLIEQPEIHLHPKMQAELADLFIETAFTTRESGPSRWNGRSYIIETHSEYLLKRIRRRMAEKDIISSEDVAIYFVHGRKEKSKGSFVERLNIDKNGAFDWPESFYETEMEDTLEFMKHQS